MRGLQLKVCDPAMGSGHFLVSLDYLRKLGVGGNGACQAEAKTPNTTRRYLMR